VTWRITDCGGFRAGWAVGDLVLIQLAPIGGGEVCPPRVWKIALQTSAPAKGIWVIRCGTMGSVELQVTPSASGTDTVDVPGTAIAITWRATVADAAGSVQTTLAPLFALPGEFVEP